MQDPNVSYLFGDKWGWQTAYKVLALVMLFIGGIQTYTFRMGFRRCRNWVNDDLLISSSCMQCQDKRSKELKEL